MDRISGLSDELLIKILLLVPTKVAVSTSILSKRWEYLWMWLPKLDYRSRYCSESECERLRCFLDRNMPLHRAPVIESFHLELSDLRIKPESINMWVVNAVYHNVRELEILYESNPDKPNILPSNLYTCKSLVVLKLDWEILLDVPRMVSLPSLKTLKLNKVKYFKDKTLQRLLSNCPILEDLVLELREGDTTRKLTVIVPSLQSLSLYLPRKCDMDGYVIVTPTVKYFKLVDDNDKSHYCLIEHMPYLIEAHLDVELPDINSVFGSITSVKRLAICSQSLVDEGFAFNQLKNLKVCLCKKHSWNQLVRLLKSSSNLRGLRISYMNGHVTEGMDDWNQPSTVPECLLSSLQTLDFSTFTEPEERDIGVYILKHAVHLKTATITPCETHFTELEMVQELSSCSRASTTCQLIYNR